jgi:hypothetical protein
MTCEGFACARLEICPGDIEQRIADGFGPALNVLGGNCPAFNFSQMVSASVPTSKLPVLFSSSRYRSHNLEQTIYPKAIVSGVTIIEYWFGLGPAGNTLCARANSGCYYFDLGKWVAGLPGADSSFRSVPDVILSSLKFTGVTTLRKLGPPAVSRTLSNTAAVVSSCQMSGDGLTYFWRTSGGWKIYDGTNNTVVPIQPQDAALWLVPSFDGNTIVLTRSPFDANHGEVVYKIGSANTETKEAIGSGTEVFAAALGDTVFVARGASISTVGSLNVYKLVYTLPSGLATGMWADNVTVWIATTVGTYMSNDAGWTWTFLEDVFAVGPGLFTKTGSANIWTNSDETFSETIGFPLRMTNGGLLSSPSTGWRNGFEDKTMNSAYTEILSTTTNALSPNGLYLLTNVGGVITLYLNTWNSAMFSEWCNSNDCRAGRAKYCQAFGEIDPECKTDTPAGPSPPTTPPEKPPKNFPVWAIALIVLGGLALIGGLFYATSRKKIKNPS